MMMNACAVLMTSRGTPMFLSGDEFGDTRFGNNNPYCQDNEISWLDWTLLETNRDLFDFFRYMIAFRQKHTVIRKDLQPAPGGFPCTSIHGLTPWLPDYTPESRTICIMYAGYDPEKQTEDIVYLAVNPYWRTLELTLPGLPAGKSWHIAVNTGDPAHLTFPDENMPEIKNTVLLGGRSVIIFTVQ